MKTLLVVLVLCGLAAAMVPMKRIQRAVNTEEEQMAPIEKTTQNICAKETPCAWQVYKPRTKIHEVYIKNTYCECNDGAVCQQDQDDTASSAFVYRCIDSSKKAHNS